MNQENRKRNGKGQFAANTSGNPAGRPTGSRNKSTSLLEGLQHAEGPAVLGKLVEMAKEGNPMAMRLILDRILPAE